MNYPKLIASIALCFFVAYAGSLVTMPAIEGWYAALEKPVFNPPNWVFGPVWTVLYALMGISLYLIWQRDQHEKKEKQALFVFIIQLFLNFLWSFVFFGLQMPVAAFLVILTLWLAIFNTIVQFRKFNKTAAYLLYPYLAWVTYASLLNLFIAAMN